MRKLYAIVCIVLTIMSASRGEVASPPATFGPFLGGNKEVEAPPGSVRPCPEGECLVYGSAVRPTCVPCHSNLRRV
jgi:hypothetical protein